GLTPGIVITGWAVTQHGGTAYWDKLGIDTQTPQSGGTFTTLSTWVRTQKAGNAVGLPPAIATIVRLDKTKRTAAQQTNLKNYFVENAWAKSQPILGPLRKALAAVEAERNKVDAQVPGTYVFKETAKPIQAYMLKRGEYDQRGDKVDRATPAFLGALPEGAPKNRLGLAHWLLSDTNPLVARVAVNRFWQQFFGAGLVKTSEDFGSQGEPPTHPELLDWLAVEFRESKWDVKHLMRLMVTSAAYRQSAAVTKESLAKDRDNRLL